MSSASVHTAGFRAELRDLYAGILNNAHQALVIAVHAAKESATSTTLFNDVTGETRANIREEMTAPLKGKVTAQGKVAVFLNEGTNPHEIRAKRGGKLRFQVQGQTVFARIVHHPGTRPRPFMDQAAEFGEQVLDYGLDDFTDRAIARFNSGE
jgi:hypothetical protein